VTPRTPYELHITRAPHWTENRGFEISAREWQDLVGDDPELLEDKSNGEHSVIWSRPDQRVGFWIDWCDGNVYTSNPDRELLEKILGIASRLGARVIGDDGTVFTRPNQALPMWDVR
jgi:hypothetical protein